MVMVRCKFLSKKKFVSFSSIYHIVVWSRGSWGENVPAFHADRPDRAAMPARRLFCRAITTDAGLSGARPGADSEFLQDPMR